jgi:hypothetical protein
MATDVLQSFGLILRAAVDAFGWIPGLGGQLHNAQNSFAQFASSVIGNMNGISGAAAAAAYNIGIAINAARAAAGATPIMQVKARQFASGGPVYGSGLAIVGEQGPELLSLPSGSYVSNAQQTRSMLSGGGGGGNVEVRLFVGDRELRTVMKRVIRTGGGDPSVMGR